MGDFERYKAAAQKSKRNRLIRKAVEELSK